MIRLLFASAAALGTLTAAPADAQSVQQTSELYHIFDFRTDAPKRDVIAAADAGLRNNTNDRNATTPIVMGPPPATPARFRIVDPWATGQLGGLAALVGAAQMTQFKQVTCDGAVWVANAVRQVRRSQTLRLTLCLFPYAGGYQLDVYGVDVQQKGGGLSERLGRALGKRLVGDMSGWTNKTILDVVRSVRTRTGATVAYVEGQPEFNGEPWLDEREVMPSRAEKEAR